MGRWRCRTLPRTPGRWHSGSCTILLPASTLAQRRGVPPVLHGGSLPALPRYERGSGTSPKHRPSGLRAQIPGWDLPRPAPRGLEGWLGGQVRDPAAFLACCLLFLPGGVAAAPAGPGEPYPEAGGGEEWFQHRYQPAGHTLARAALLLARLPSCPRGRPGRRRPPPCPSAKVSAAARFRGAGRRSGGDAGSREKEAGAGPLLVRAGGAGEKLGRGMRRAAGREVPLCYLLPAHCLPKGRAASPSEPREEQGGKPGDGSVAV